jgi:Tfp pilus assembly protein PilV
MNTPSITAEICQAERPSRRIHPRGFALIVTLSLMILLTVIAVGLLSLSSISLRSTGEGSAASIARANARMALMLAIGDLQKAAGPDQRITAPADILDEKSANPHLTGIWKSRNTIATSPTAGDFAAAAKKEQFLGWLVSTATPKDSLNQDFAATAASDPFKLWDTGSLGTDAPARDLVEAGKVKVSGTSKGAYSWAVMDEGVKARLNTTFDNSTTTDGGKTAQLGSGQRPGIEFMSGLTPLTRDKFEKSAPTSANVRKGITWMTSQLAAESIAQKITPELQKHTHDLTAYSSGLFTDVTTGGFKEDFHLLAENTTLPAPYVGKGIYASRLGIKTSTATSDPRWESLYQFARLYRQTNTLTKTGNVPVLKATAPAGWVAANDATNPEEAPFVRPAPPAGVVLMPTIAKVQVVFTLATRDIYKSYPKNAVPVPESAPQLHGPWGDNFKGTKYDYILHMIYTPVVTLHNPYNVTLQFTKLKVNFINVPFAMKVWRNGIAQTSDLVPLDQMYYSTAEAGNRSKQFGMTMMTQSASKGGSDTFKLLPGEVKLFSPYIEPTRTWEDENTQASRIFFDYDGGSSDRAFLMEGVPGWRGDGIGFDLDWFCAKPFRNLGDKETMDVAGATGSLVRDGCIPLQANDNLYFEFAPYSIANANSKFIVKMSAVTPNSTTPVNTGAIELNYETPRGLQTFLLGANGKMRYPKTGTLTALSLHDHYADPIKEYAHAKPFAILSAQAKTTYGAQDTDKREGRSATKPWVFAHASIGASTAKVISEHPANHSHEIDLILLEKNTDITDHLQIDTENRGNFITGHTGQKGSKFGVMYDIPLAPIQSLSSLNGANPGGSSGYLPRFAQPIGNSWASPMLPADQSRVSASPAQLFDHSFLLNTALYDHFYFSGLATQTGAFSTGKSSTQLISDFSEGMPLADPRIELHLPDGAPATDLASKMGTANAVRHTQIAAWQQMNGAFNINSTSVSAWKAMLGSIQSKEALYNKLSSATATSLATLPAPEAAEARISRLRLPASTSKDPNAYWLGPRELKDGELDTLATAIVAQVRERGPFLSLSEFVNRQLGSGRKSLSGALQTAIDLSGINTQNTPEAEGEPDHFSGYQIGAAQVAGYNYKNPEAGTGNSADGAPGAISQADILAVLGNTATPRSDTFTIRAYAEARDSAGKVTATACCEAVIQRQAEYVDSTDPADAVPPPVSPATTTSPILTSQANLTFGRRFNLVSFRWLSKAEI